MLIGGNSPTQGYTDRARAAATVFGPGVMLWLSSAGPQDALKHPGCVHIVRLDNWTVDMTPAQYVANVAPQVTRWRSVPNVVYVLGNEPDVEAGHHGEQIGLYADAMRAAFPGVKVANPPLSVEQSSRVEPNGCDVVVMHSYFERQHPDSIIDPQFGRSYQYGLDIAAGRPVYVTEFNVVQTNCPIDWADRNKQAAAWLDQAEHHGVAGVCFFILDAGPEWATFDVGPEAATDILARRAPPAPPPPPPPPPVTTGYARASDPRGYRPLDARWRLFIAAHNPDEADAICNAYEDGCKAIGYDANCAIAQGCVECAIFTSPRWVNAHAAAGIGIGSDSTPDVIWGQGKHGDARTGVLAQCELLSDYYGSGVEPWGIIAAHGFGGMTLHKTRLSDMDGVWAADTGYSAAIVGYLTLVLGGNGPPVPPPPTGIPLTAIRDIAAAHIGKAITDEGVPEFGMCEQEFEEWCEEAGLPRTRYATAAADGTVRLQRGEMRATMPPPPGAGLIWEPPFDPSGHICCADDYPYVVTTYPGSVSRIDAVANGWYAAAGFIGWFVPDGATEGGVPAQEVDMLVEGHLDDAMIQRLWYGAATAAAKKKMAYNPGSGIGQRWKKELLAGHPLGAVQSGEESDKASGRVIQYFSNGAVTYVTATGETFVN